MSEWGSWVSHNGGANPCPNMKVAIRIRAKFKGTPNGNPDCDNSEVWVWRHDGTYDDIVEYRIRKPKGLTILEQILNDLPAPTNPTVPA